MIRPHEAICDVFLKVGGSVLDDPARTAALADRLVSIEGNPQRVVVLTGGGRIAKRIKANQLNTSCGFNLCWRATTLALDVNAGLLASHSPVFCVTNSIGTIMAAHESHRIPIFAPADALFASLWFTPNWTVTTDTMGLYFAHIMGAQRYVIVTDVDGICERAPTPGVSIAAFPQIEVRQLENLSSSKLDAAFPAFFRKYPLETIVVNGSHPNRVIAAVCGRRTVGTQILLDSGSLSSSGRPREPPTDLVPVNGAAR